MGYFYAILTEERIPTLAKVLEVSEESLHELHKQNLRDNTMTGWWLWVKEGDGRDK